jgi:hypothetical protein
MGKECDEIRKLCEMSRENFALNGFAQPFVEKARLARVIKDVGIMSKTR